MFGWLKKLHKEADLKGQYEKAVLSQDLPAIQRLLDKGADPNWKVNFDFASDQNDVSKMRRKYGEISALSFATGIVGNRDMVRMLLEGGANPTVKDEFILQTYKVKHNFDTNELGDVRTKTWVPHFESDGVYPFSAHVYALDLEMARLFLKKGAKGSDLGEHFNVELYFRDSIRRDVVDAVPFLTRELGRKDPTKDCLESNYRYFGNQFGTALMAATSADMMQYLLDNGANLYATVPKRSLGAFFNDNIVRNGYEVKPMDYTPVNAVQRKLEWRRPEKEVEFIAGKMNLSPEALQKYKSEAAKEWAEEDKLMIKGISKRHYETPSLGM